MAPGPDANKVDPLCPKKKKMWQFPLHAYSKEGGKPFVAHEVLDLTGKPP